MGYMTLKNEDGKSYKATCCNVVAEHLSTEEGETYEEQRVVKGETVTFVVTPRTHKMACPNIDCGMLFDAHDTVAQAMPPA